MTRIVEQAAFAEFLARNDLESIRVALSTVHPADAAAVLAGMPAAEAARVLPALHERKAADILAFLEPEAQGAIAARLGRGELARIVAAMAHDERADLFNRLSEAEREALLPALAAAEREDLFPAFAVSRGSELFGSFAFLGHRLVAVDTFPARSPVSMLGGYLRADRRILERIATDRPHVVINLCPHLWSPVLMLRIRRLTGNFKTQHGD